MSYSLFAVGGTRRLKENGQERGIKEKERRYPIYPRREADPLHCFSQYKETRRGGEESVRYLKRRFVKRPGRGTSPPRAATTGDLMGRGGEGF